MKCKACPKTLTEKDFIVDERGELCYTCMGAALVTAFPDYPIYYLTEDEEDE